MLQQILDWASENRVMLIWSGAIALATFVIGAIAAPIVVVQLPADYFDRSAKRKQKWTPKKIAKNVIGGVLAIAGLAMLVVPGPGLIVLLIGIALADFPGKHRLQRWLITRGSVLKKANKLRARYGKEPLRVNGVQSSHAHA
jgi:hypothetical protein